MNLLLLKQVDAIIGFDFLMGWQPDKVDMIKLAPTELIRVSTGAIGILVYSKDKKEAQNFIDFALKNSELFKRYGYKVNPEEVYHFVGTKKIQLGGLPVIKEDWSKTR